MDRRWCQQIRALALSPFVPSDSPCSSTRNATRTLEALRPLIEAGQVTPVIDRTYPLAEVPGAIRHLEAGRARGRIAITI
jgi:NADPH:quinone reductase-like Zn-dependent oxidoreductase